MRDNLEDDLDEIDADVAEKQLKRNQALKAQNPNSHGNSGM